MPAFVGVANPGVAPGATWRLRLMSTGNVAMKPPANGAFGIWEGTWVAFEPIMPRCSAAVAIAWPCVPKVVVRLGRRTSCRADQDDPRVSARQLVRRPLVNDLGPECEVKTRTSLPAFFTTLRSAGFQPEALRKFAANAEGEKALAIRPHPNPLPRGEGELQRRRGGGASFDSVVACQSAGGHVRQILACLQIETGVDLQAGRERSSLSLEERVGVRANRKRFFALPGRSGNREGNSL